MTISFHGEPASVCWPCFLAAFQRWRWQCLIDADAARERQALSESLAAQAARLRTA